MNLPEGFILDKPVRTQPTVTPPPGFVIDSDINNTTTQAQSLISRFGKGLYNAIPEIERGIYKQALRFSPGVMELTIKAQDEILSGSLGPEEAKRMQEYLAKGRKLAERLKPIPVPEAKTWQEKGVDVAAGLIKFMAQLGILRKGLPKGTPEGIVWEMQNLVTGGTPGHGAAMYALFGIPGKVIPGTSKLAKGGKLAAESVLLGGTTALEQKLTTGEIDWKDVAVSAGIPVALHSLGYVKSRIKAGDKKVIEAARNIRTSQWQATTTAGDILKRKAEQKISTGKNPEPSKMTKQEFSKSGEVVNHLVRLTQAYREGKIIPQKVFDSYSNDLQSTDYGTKWTAKQIFELKKLQETKPVKPGQIVNAYKTTSGSRTNIPETGIVRQGERYIDKVTGEDVILDKTASGSAMQNAPKSTTIPAEAMKGKVAGESLAEKKWYHGGPTTLEGGGLVEGMVTHDYLEALHFSKQHKNGVVYEVSPKAVDQAKPGSKDENGMLINNPEQYGFIKPVKREDMPFPVKIVTGETVVETPSIDTTIKKINEYAGKAAEFRKTEREPALKEFHAKQVAGGKEQLEINKDKTAQERLRSIGKGMYGTAEKGEFTPPPLENSEWNTISQKAIDVYGDDVFKLNNIQKSLDSWRNTGKLPTNYELGLLEPVIGESTIENLYKLAQKQRKFTPWDIIPLTISTLKSPFGYDPQAARQLSGIMFRNPLIYIKNVYKNIRAYTGKDYASKLSEQLEADPMWKLAQKKAELNLLGVKPWKALSKTQTRLQQYGDFTEALNKSDNKFFQKWGKLLSASERGANLGIDSAMIDLLKGKARQLEQIQERNIRRGKPIWTEEQVDKYWKDAGKDINAFTKRVIATNPSARKIQNAANLIMFSPAYTASYPYRSWRTLRNLFAGTPGNRTTALQYTLSQIAALTALSAIPAYVAHKYRTNNPTEEPPIDSSTNPLNTLWGHLRHGTDVYDFTFGEGSYYRLLGRIGVSAVLYGEKLATGKERTQLWNRTAPNAGEEIRRFLASRETVALGLAKTLMTGKDWLGNPIDTQFVINQMMPMSALKDLVDAGFANGTWQSTMQEDISEGSKNFMATIPPALTGVLGAGVTSYKVNPSSTRSNFRNVIAKNEYKKPWDDLTRIEQARLNIKYKDSFNKLNMAVSQYRVENPTNTQALVDKIRTEENKSGDKIRKKLNSTARELLKGVSVNVNRSPRKLFLNDKRYNRYMELTAKYLNERVVKLKLDNVRPDIKKSMLQSAVIYAKAKAYYDLEKEGI
jgi:hypothetical protein